MIAACTFRPPQSGIGGRCPGCQLSHGDGERYTSPICGSSPASRTGEAARHIQDGQQSRRLVQSVATASKSACAATGARTKRVRAEFAEQVSFRHAWWWHTTNDGAAKGSPVADSK